MKPLGRVVAVIPAYNEAPTIGPIASKTLTYVDELIVIDDGSSDQTAAALAGMNITVVRNPSNLGKGKSLARGSELALERGASLLVTLDADGQHRPEDIPRLRDAAHRYPGHIVIGYRLADRTAIPTSRYLANRFANFWIAWAAGYRILDSQSGFRVYPADLLARLPAKLRDAEGFVYESQILIEAAHLGVRSVFVPIAAVYSASARPSHFKGIRDVLKIVRMIAGKLLTQRLNILGLMRSLRDRAVVVID